MRHDRTQAPSLDEVIGSTNHKHSLGRSKLDTAGLDAKHAKVPAAHPAVEFHSLVDGHDPAAGEPNTAAEEGNKAAAEAEAKIVLIGALQEKRASFREKKWKTVDIQLSAVHLGL